MVEDDDPATWSTLRVATKYPEITRRYFARRGGVGDQDAHPFGLGEGPRHGSIPVLRLCVI
jgi:hypothetical protein